MNIPLKMTYICLQLEVENRILGEYNNYKKLHCKNRIVKIINVLLCTMARIFLVYTGCCDSMIKYTCTIINYHVQLSHIKYTKKIWKPKMILIKMLFCFFVYLIDSIRTIEIAIIRL